MEVSKPPGFDPDPGDVERSLTQYPPVIKVQALLRSSGLIGYKIFNILAHSVPCKDLQTAKNIMCSETNRRSRRGIAVPAIPLPEDSDFKVVPKVETKSTSLSPLPLNVFPQAKALVKKAPLPKIQFKIGKSSCEFSKVENGSKFKTALPVTNGKSKENGRKTPSKPHCFSSPGSGSSDEQKLPSPTNKNTNSKERKRRTCRSSRSPTRKSEKRKSRHDSSFSSSSSSSKNSDRKKYKRRHRSRSRKLPQRRTRSRTKSPCPRRLPTPPPLKIPSIFPLILQLQHAGKFTPALEDSYKQMEFDERALVADLKIWHSQRLSLSLPEADIDSSYKESWLEFWRLRSGEIVAEGKFNPDKYDYLPEWKEVWAKKVELMLQEKFTKSLKEIREKYGFDEKSIQNILTGREPISVTEPKLASPVAQARTKESKKPVQVPAPSPPQITSPWRNQGSKSSDLSKITQEIQIAAPSPGITLATVSQSWEKLTGLKVKLDSKTKPVESLESLNSKAISNSSPSPTSTAKEQPLDESGPLVQNILRCLYSFGDQMSAFLQPKIQKFHEIANQAGIGTTTLLKEDFELKELLGKCQKRLEIMVKLPQVPPDTADKMNECLAKIFQLIPEPREQAIPLQVQTEGSESGDDGGKLTIDLCSGSDDEGSVFEGDRNSEGYYESENSDYSYYSDRTESSYEYDANANCNYSRRGAAKLQFQIKDGIAQTLETDPNRKKKIEEIVELISNNLSAQEHGFGWSEMELLNYVGGILEPLIPTIQVPEPIRIIRPDDPFAQLRNPSQSDSQ